RFRRAGIAKSTEQVGFHAQLQTGLELLDAQKMSGLRYLKKRIVAAPSGPVGGLVLAPDVALEIDAERVEIGSGSQRRERDPDLGRPSVLRDARFRPPALVPLGVDVVPLVGDERV